jgi:glycosyltransferase involved in cell wall biosynthesis
MRIALFSGNYNYLREGANQALNKLVGYLEDVAGHSVRVYSPITNTPAFEPAGTLVPVASIRLPVRGEFQLALGLPRGTKRDIEQFAPDIFHVSTPDILGTRAQTFARRLGIPVVASLHTLFETYPAYYGVGWARPAVEAHLRRFYRRSEHVFAPTPSLVEQMKRLRGDDCSSVWSRGIDRTLFNPRRRNIEWRRDRGIGDHEIVVLFFGRLVLEKGVATFVAVLHALQQRGLPVRPMIVGGGPARDAFDRLSGVIATGHLAGEGLACAVASADIMLTPSTTETFGNVILEAMASAVAVVSADAPNARALINDGQTGFLAPASDVTHFVATIGELVTNAPLRRSVGASAMIASAAYSWEGASASVETIYRQVKRGGQTQP